jgi:pimeloyl-ACP methyl ester carboxylesterase
MLYLNKTKIFSAVAAAVVASALTVTAADAHPGGNGTAKPTVVLVHGAFADASGYAGVVHRLLTDGYPVIAPANPLRGVASDAAAIKAVLDSIDGPIVLVGHSYGGNVISEAATGDKNIKALVYLSAFVPETGETTAGLTDMFPGSVVGDSLKQVPVPDGQTDLYIDPKVFPSAFAGDLPATDAKVLAVSQRAVTAAALNEPAAGPQAWHTIPAYDLIGTADKIIPPAAQEFMAERAHAKILLVRGASHLAFVSHPDTTAAFIEKAAHDTVR